MIPHEGMIPLTAHNSLATNQPFIVHILPVIHFNVPFQTQLDNFICLDFSSDRLQTVKITHPKGMTNLTTCRNKSTRPTDGEEAGLQVFAAGSAATPPQPCFESLWQQPDSAKRLRWGNGHRGFSTGIASSDSKAHTSSATADER